MPPHRCGRAAGRSPATSDSAACLRRGTASATARTATARAWKWQACNPTGTTGTDSSPAASAAPSGERARCRRRIARSRELRLAVACCQHFEHGHYAALAHMAADAPRRHRASWATTSTRARPRQNRVRAHVGNLCRTLEDYRLRYAQYQLDPSLQAAHAAAPWLCTWDDHEVANDYAGIYSGRAEEPAVFLARRTAAYQAYFEHLPLPPSAAPRGSETPHLRAPPHRQSRRHPPAGPAPIPLGTGLPAARSRRRQSQ